MNNLSKLMHDIIKHLDRIKAFAFKTFCVKTVQRCTIAD